MVISVILVSVDAATGVKPIARSTDLELARHVILTLQKNRLHEDDEADVIYDSNFLMEAERMLAYVTAQIRRDAADSFLNVDELDVDELDAGEIDLP